eukprot:TRINITY_DN123971_c0_g1_i1.p1 TRINITY_DN123971_c0_g1~~TRINITY_DN123971_c0_g1_i1.p1  ORF type:complete len:726 (+),score=165.63 TRINITY_DN123971_c0_g1_i1:91-2268(+)
MAPSRRAAAAARGGKANAKAAAPAKALPADDVLNSVQVDFQRSISPVESMERAFRENMAVMRRRSLSLLDVVSERQKNGPLRLHRILVAASISWVYSNVCIPMWETWGTAHYFSQVGEGRKQPLAGGPAADVHASCAILVTIAYLSMVFFGCRFMEGRAPTQKRVFEHMAVYNCTQAFLNLSLAWSLWREAWNLGYLQSPWGNTLSQDGSSEHKLGMLLWFQYHLRQLDLFDTLFMILRKKFRRVSCLHIYIRLLHMWGWFFACKYACGGDSYFPAAVNCTCQVLVYIYYTAALMDGKGYLRRSIVIDVQVAQLAICLVHAIFVLYMGNLPRGLALLNIFVMLSSLVLFMDFEGHQPRLVGKASSRDLAERDDKVTFCFDSSGWFFIYHFGAAKWIEEHLMPENMNPQIAESDQYPKDIAFSGSSGGSLLAGTLAMGISVRDLLEHVLTTLDYCRFNPFRMLGVCEEALRRFVPENAGKTMTGRARVLLTRVTWKPPFLQGEVVDQFADKQDAERTLRASSHVPGLKIKPYRLHTGWYYDGMMWSSLLVPWQAAEDSRHLIKVSALSQPLTDIRAPLQPIWWAMLPPPLDALRGLFWCGYRDMALYFATPPVDAGCKCRRPSTASPPPSPNGKSLDKWEKERERSESGAEPDKLRSSRLEKYHAAKKLVLRPIAPRGQELPEFDPVTGQRVSYLIDCFHQAIEFQFKALFGVLLLAFTLAIAYGL